MVEVKVGDCSLEQQQFDNYHNIAKASGFKALVTISNQTATPDGLPPVAVDGRRVRAVPVVHLSWDRLLSEARVLTRADGIEDEDQTWMLGEWIRYVTDPQSRIIAPASLGDHWTDVLQAAREGNLVAVSRFVPETVDHWESFLRKISLRLRAHLGVEVERRLLRADKKDPTAFAKRIVDEVLETGILSGAFRVPDAAGDIFLEVSLQARTVRYSVEIKPPSEGRVQTRINWLVRQLKGDEVPKDLLISVEWDQVRVSSHARIGEAQSDPSILLRDPHREMISAAALPRKFMVEWTTSVAKCKGRSSVPVLDSIAADLEHFYRNVVERLVLFVPKAPRLPDPKPDREAALSPVEDYRGQPELLNEPSPPVSDEVVLVTAEKVNSPHDEGH